MNRSAVAFTTSCVLGLLALTAPAFPQGTTETRPAPVAAVAAGGMLSKVAPIVAAGRAQARVWQADARLIGVFVKAGLDGKVDLAKLAGPTNLDGGFVSLQFHSTAAGSGQTYTVDASGRLEGFSMPVGTATAAIPEKFLDLDEAMTKARELGLKLPAAGAKGFIDARLVGVNLERPRPAAATWKIMAVDTSGPLPMPVGEPVVVDAATGAPVIEGDAPAATRPADRAPGRIDRFLVGSWKGSIPEGEIAIEFTLTGDFKMTGSGGGRTLEQTGTIEAVDGKWQMHASTGETFGGTYRMSDKNTLAWTDPKQDRTVTLRRTDRSPRNPRGPDLRPTSRGENEGPASRR